MLDEANRTSGARLLATDARVAFLVLNDARYRAMARLLGVSKEQANAATVIGALLVAESLHARSKHWAQAPMPSAGDWALGATALRESTFALLKQSPSDTPLLGTLIAIAVVGGLARPVAVRTLRGIRVSTHQLHAGFNHRYGHLIRHGQRHVSRARSLARDRLSPAAGR